MLTAASTIVESPTMTTTKPLRTYHVQRKGNTKNKRVERKVLRKGWEGGREERQEGRKTSEPASLAFKF